MPLKISYFIDSVMNPSFALAYLRQGEPGVYDVVARRLVSSITGLTIKRVTSSFTQAKEELKDFKDRLQVKMCSVGKPLGEMSLWQAEVLYVVIRVLKPSVVVETGVASGISSAFMLRGLEANENGRLYSVDLPNYEEQLLAKGMYKVAGSLLPEGKEVGWLVPYKLKKKWDLRLGLVEDVLPALLKGLGSIEMFVHDSEHTYENMTFEYNVAWRHLANGGVLLSHDTTMNNAFRDFCSKIAKKPAVHFRSTGLMSFNGVRK